MSSRGSETKNSAGQPTNEQIPDFFSLLFFPGCCDNSHEPDDDEAVENDECKPIEEKVTLAPVVPQPRTTPRTIRPSHVLNPAGASPSRFHSSNNDRKPENARGQGVNPYMPQRTFPTAQSSLGQAKASNRPPRDELQSHKMRETDSVSTGNATLPALAGISAPATTKQGNAAFIKPPAAPIASSSSDKSAATTLQPTPELKKAQSFGISFGSSKFLLSSTLKSLEKHKKEGNKTEVMRDLCNLINMCQEETQKKDVEKYTQQLYSIVGREPPSTCSICLDDMDLHADPFEPHEVLHGCYHSFHASCTMEWRKRQKVEARSCPECRHK